MTWSLPIGHGDYHQSQYNNVLYCAMITPVTGGTPVRIGFNI